MINNFDSLANKFSKAAKKKGITLRSLLRDLKRIRRERSSELLQVAINKKSVVKKKALAAFKLKLSLNVKKALVGAASRFSENNWFDLWHTHVDWDSEGMESVKHRDAELKALFMLNNHIHKQMKKFDKPYQQFVLIYENDPGQDAVYLHSKNPNKTVFPYKAKKITWLSKVPEWLAKYVDLKYQRIGKSVYKNQISYIIQGLDNESL